MVEKGQHKTTVAAATLERRSGPRVKANHATLLTMPHAHPVEAWVLDVSSRGARLRVPAPVPAGAAVRIEARELLLFGNVTRCQPMHGAYDVGVALSQPLEMLGELQKLEAALLGESEPA